MRRRLRLSPSSGPGLPCPPPKQSPQSHASQSRGRGPFCCARVEHRAPQPAPRRVIGTAPLVRHRRIDEHESGDFTREAMRVHADDVGAQRMRREDVRRADLDRDGDAAQVIGQCVERSIQARVAAPSESAPVVTAGSRAIRERGLHRGPAKTRCAEAGLENRDWPAPADLADVKTIHESSRRRHARSSGGRGVEGCDQASIQSYVTS